jgi:DNA-binding winged helix-turn-helix (wHTH) protein
MRYFFGDYVLDTQRHELQRAGESLKLRCKAFQVLAYLLVHRERVVPKQELLEHVWSDQFVGDEVLKACITALRKALGERGRTSRFVRTLHGQGYCFVVPVEVREHLPAADALPALHRRAGEGTTYQTEGPAPALALRLADLGSLSSEARDGEHKHITVLCGALADVPALTARLGPESLYRLLQAWLALWYGSTVGSARQTCRGPSWLLCVAVCRRRGCGPRRPPRRCSSSWISRCRMPPSPSSAPRSVRLGPFVSCTSSVGLPVSGSPWSWRWRIYIGSTPPRKPGWPRWSSGSPAPPYWSWSPTGRAIGHPGSGSRMRPRWHCHP